MTWATVPLGNDGSGISNIAWWKFGSNFSPFGIDLLDPVLLERPQHLALGELRAFDDCLERLVRLLARLRRDRGEGPRHVVGDAEHVAGEFA